MSVRPAFCSSITAAAPSKLVSALESPVAAALSVITMYVTVTPDSRRRRASEDASLTPVMVMAFSATLNIHSVLLIAVRKPTASAVPKVLEL